MKEINMQNGRKKVKSFLLVALIGWSVLVLAEPVTAHAADVTLAWDESTDSDVASYRLFMRCEGESYDLSDPVWSGTGTSAVVTGLDENTMYYFVARAVSADDVESDNSNEVSYTPAGTAVQNDTDGDGTVDELDTDDDGDGMPDDWENFYGLNPLVNDAEDDLDGDGVSNGDEYADGTDPSVSVVVQSRPSLTYPANESAEVSLMPALITEEFEGFVSGETHVRTEWQIGLDDAFSSQVYRLTTASFLEEVTVPEQILIPNTTYHWRVRFYGDRDGRTEWSEPFQFATGISENGDDDADGVPDWQEATADTDLDQDGVSDVLQEGIRVVNRLELEGQIGIKLMSGSGSIQSMEMVSQDSLPAREEGATPPEMIAFRLAVDEGAIVEVGVYFSETLPETSEWYKYDLQHGWQDYSDHVEFADLAGGGTVAVLELQDGGFGDADGIANGIIVDPSGPVCTEDDAAAAVQSGSVEASSDGSGSGGCFLAVSQDHFSARGGAALLLTITLLAGMCAVRKK